MEAISKINNNFALCLDNNGTEVIVYGRGVGFGKFPCEIPLDKIEKTFYDVHSKYLSIIANLSSEIIEISATIAEQAEIELECELNPNLPFSLADHLSFSLDRMKKEMLVNAPISFDIKYLYPREFKLGIDGLHLIKEKIGLELPENEAISIAMHLINAESKNDNMHDLMAKTEIITTVHLIIEEQLSTKIDINSYQFSRFAVHLSYLIQRFESGQHIVDQDSSMLNNLARSNHENYVCAQKIAKYFQQQWQWTCNNEEKLYLMLHIYRIQEKNE